MVPTEQRGVDLGLAWSLLGLRTAVCGAHLRRRALLLRLLDPLDGVAGHPPARPVLGALVVEDRDLAPADAEADVGGGEGQAKSQGGGQGCPEGGEPALELIADGDPQRLDEARVWVRIDRLH